MGWADFSLPIAVNETADAVEIAGRSEKRWVRGESDWGSGARVAISNQRLQSLENGNVTFQWKDYRHKNKQKSRTMTLASEEFIRRFLIHTLPPGFARIRHFGLLANRHRKAKLALCRQLLPNPILQLLPDTAGAWQTRLEKVIPLPKPRNIQNP